MTETTINICRLCLKSEQDLDVINDSQNDIIQLVLPQIKLDCSSNPRICKDCAKLLKQSFDFKSKCLEIEDNIHDYKQDEKDQVNLEKVLGIEGHNSKCTKICRTCLGYLENKRFIQLDEENGMKSVIGECVPEMDIKLTLNPVICEFCENNLKEIHNFIISCIKNEEKISFYFERSDNLTLADIVRYEQSKDNSANMDLNLQCTEDFKDIFDEHTFQTYNEQNTSSSLDSSDSDDMYTASDSEEDSSDDETTRFGKGKRSGRPRKRSLLTSRQDSSSDDDWLSAYGWNKPVPAAETIVPKKKLKVTETETETETNLQNVLKGMIFCKYCYHGSTSELSAKKHISNCQQNPYLKGIKFPTAKNTDTPSDFDKENTIEPNIVTVTVTIPTKQLKEKTRMIKKAEKSMTVLKTAKVAENLTPLKNTTNINGNKSNIDDSSLIEETEVVFNDFSVVEPAQSPVVPEKVTTNREVLKITYSTLKNDIDDEAIRKNVELAIKNNQKPLLSQLDVLECNSCGFNSRSTLKMAVHCWSHSTNKDNTVDYSTGYTTVFYCVNCTKSFPTAQCLLDHVDGCERVPDDEVILFKVGKVKHCTKCFFDSEHTETVLDHLLSCGKIKISTNL